MKKNIFTSIIFLGLSLGVYAQTITTWPLTGTGTFNAGNTIGISFTTDFQVRTQTSANEYMNYYFILELSDINGSFASPTRISEFNSYPVCNVTPIGEALYSSSNAIGTIYAINGTIPVNITPASTYRIRVNSVQKLDFLNSTCNFSTVSATTNSRLITIVAPENKHVIHNNSTSVLILPSSIESKEIYNKNLSNISIGSNAIEYAANQSNNTAIGYEAGINSKGSSNTFLGSKTDVSLSSISNSTAVGYGVSVDVSNKVRLGNTAVTVIEGQVAYTYPSDRRLKENIVYTDRLGLNFINRLNTVSYNYKSDATKVRRDGLIAQDIQQTLKDLNIPFSGLVEGSDPNKTLTLASSELVFPLINAVKELNQKIESLEKRNQKLEATINNIYSTMKIEEGENTQK